MEPIDRRAVTRRAFVAGLVSVTVAPMVACGSDGARRNASSMSSLTAGSIVELPSPTAGSATLDAALRQRRSVRAFTPDALSDNEVGQLLWAGQGITADWGGRTAPSAGALYPLELHAVTARRTMHYRPAGHQLEVSIERDVRTDLMAAAHGQEPVGAAPLTIVIVAVPARTAAKYGDRSVRYVDLEAGHTAQNVLLEAVALGLGAVPIGAFDDAAVAHVLGLPEGHEARYLLAVGRPQH